MFEKEYYDYLGNEYIIENFWGKAILVRKPKDITKFLEKSNVAPKEILSKIENNIEKLTRYLLSHHQC